MTKTTPSELTNEQLLIKLYEIDHPLYFDEIYFEFERCYNEPLSVSYYEKRKRKKEVSSSWGDETITTYFSYLEEYLNRSLKPEALKGRGYLNWESPDNFLQFETEYLVENQFEYVVSLPKLFAFSIEEI